MATLLDLNPDDLNGSLADNANVAVWTSNGIPFGNTNTAQQLRLVKNVLNGHSVVRAVDRNRALRTPVVAGVPTATALDALKAAGTDHEVTVVFTPTYDPALNTDTSPATLIASNAPGEYKKIWYTVEDGQVSRYSHQVTSAQIKINQTYIITVSYKVLAGGRCEYRIYQNGRYVSRTVIADSAVTDAVPWTLFSSGTTDGTTAYGFQGDLARVQVFDTVRTDAQRSTDTAALAALYGIPLDHVPANPALRIVTDGDSQVAAHGAKKGGKPSEYIRQWLSPSVETVNLGVGGWDTNNLIADAPVNVDPYALDAVPTVLLVHIGTNNIAQDGQDVGDVTAGIQTYCEARRAAGWNPINGKYIVVDTILPRDSSTFGAGSASFEDERNAVNAWLRANYQIFADALVDGGADATIGVIGAISDTTLYLDRVHLSDLGNRYLAARYRSGIQNLQNTASVGTFPTTAQTAAVVRADLEREGGLLQQATSRADEAASFAENAPDQTAARILADPTHLLATGAGGTVALATAPPTATAIAAAVVGTETVQRVAASVGAYGGTRSETSTTVTETLNRPGGGAPLVRVGTAATLTVTPGGN